MERLRNLRQAAVALPLNYALMLLMCCSIVYPWVTPAMGLGFTLFQVIGLCAVCLLVCSAMMLTRWTALISTVLLLCTLIIVMLLYVLGVRDGQPTHYRQQAEAFLSWASEYLAGHRKTNALFAGWLAAIFAFLVSLSISVVTQRRFSALAVSLCGAASFAAMAIIGHAVNVPSVFVCIFASLLYFLTQNRMRPLLSAGAPKAGVFLLSSLPFAAVVLVVTIVLSQALLIDPAWMKDTRDKILNKHTAPPTGASQVLHGDHLGGNIAFSGALMMRVASPKGNLRLRAGSMDEYTGQAWERSDTSRTGVGTSEPIFPDTRSTLGALELTDAAAAENLLDSSKGAPGMLFTAYRVAVQYEGIKTDTLFLPLNTTRVELPDNTQCLLSGTDALVLASTAPAGFEYDAGCFAPNAGDLFDSYVRSSSLPGVSGNAASGQSADVSARYLQLPTALPKRVRDLAGAITDGLSSDYDKARAIEQYLSENYTYTLSPGTPDTGEDFVDQFLFQGKKGYCTYYASAMTVLLRCAGIPARYVVGYAVPGQETSPGIYSVTDRCAHAWAEAYFVGVGWLAFEPSSGYNSGLTGAGNPESTPTPSPQASKAPAPTPSHTPQKATTKPDHTAVAVQPVKPAGTFPTWLLALVLAVLTLSGALVACVYFIRRGMDRLEPKEAALALFGQYLRLLGKVGVTLQSGETASSFAARCDGLLNLSGEFAQATVAFETARFSSHEVTADHKQLMLDFRKELLEALRKRLGLVRYLYYRWILGY